ncbi:tyrosine-protein phosphatase [Rosenbergiella epipactidis]|uniref:tyrosine-protein phosphatase n=1 Tax=Rosenbergiella epipactidis TaxID=1544694 RepID=UPI001F4ED53A|nr:tyrosine-protein phosphatase [Rosenbergiella epipactidis]
MMSQPIRLQSIANFRQLGGLLTKEGRKIRSNCLFRCSALDRLTAQDSEQLAQLAGVTILDYRDIHEAQAKPDQIVTAANYLNIPANPPDLVVDAKVVEFSPQAIEALDVDRFMTQLYQQLPFNNPAWRQLIATLSHPETQTLIQHCAVGKDRTGLGCAITLLLLGCEESVIIDDYLATNGRLEEIGQQALALWPAGVSEKAQANFRQLLSVDKAWLVAALTAIKQRYASIEQWLEQEYGVTAQQRQSIQDKWLEA